MKIYGIVCPICNDFIYSRARHDFNICSCESVYIDGGHLMDQDFSFKRICFNENAHEKGIISAFIELDVTVKQLYDDWHFEKNIYGRKKMDSSISYIKYIIPRKGDETENNYYEN